MDVATVVKNTTTPLMIVLINTQNKMTEGVREEGGREGGRERR